MFSKILKIFNKRSPLQIDTLHFKDNKSAFEFACEYLDCSIVPDGVLPAIVSEVKITPPDDQIMIITLPSKSGGYEIMCTKRAKGTGYINKGDFVAYKLFKFNNTRITMLSMYGAVVAKLKPEFHITEGWNTIPPIDE